MKEYTTDARGQKLPACTCPTCGYSLTAAKMFSCDHRPRPGDFTVCMNCAELMRFEENMRIKLVTPEVYQAVPKRLRRYIEAMRAYVRQQPWAGSLVKNRQ